MRGILFNPWTTFISSPFSFVRSCLCCQCQRWECLTATFLCFLSSSSNLRLCFQVSLIVGHFLLLSPRKTTYGPIPMCFFIFRYSPVLWLQHQLKSISVRSIFMLGVPPSLCVRPVVFVTLHWFISHHRNSSMLLDWKRKT